VTQEERRVLSEELVESVTIFPSHFEISVYGAPTLKVLPGEVGMKQSDSVGVGDPTRQECNLSLATKWIGQFRNWLRESYEVPGAIRGPENLPFAAKFRLSRLSQSSSVTVERFPITLTGLSRN